MDDLDHGALVGSSCLLTGIEVFGWGILGVWFDDDFLLRPKWQRFFDVTSHVTLQIHQLARCVLALSAFEWLFAYGGGRK